MFVQAGIDPEGTGSDAKGIGTRAGYAISGAIHAALTLEAARLAVGLGAGGKGDSGPQDWTALALAQPFGRWIMVAVGLGIAAFGLAELVRAYRTDLPKRLDLSHLSQSRRGWVVRFGRMGMAARGVVFGVIGSFLVRAALNYDPSQARGLGGLILNLGYHVKDQALPVWLVPGTRCHCPNRPGRFRDCRVALNPAKTSVRCSRPARGEPTPPVRHGRGKMLLVHQVQNRWRDLRARACARSCEESAQPAKGS